MAKQEIESNLDKKIKTAEKRFNGKTDAMRHLGYLDPALLRKLSGREIQHILIVADKAYRAGLAEGRNASRTAS